MTITITQSNLPKTTTDLVALEGSDKQVAWANEIRARVVSDLDGLALFAGIVFPGADTSKLSIFRDAILAQAQAKWWIDNARFYEPACLPREWSDRIECDCRDEFGFAAMPDETAKYRLGLRDAAYRLANLAKKAV